MEIGDESEDAQILGGEGGKREDSINRNLCLPFAPHHYATNLAQPNFLQLFGGELSGYSLFQHGQKPR
jgi:hypothetical protein